MSKIQTELSRPVLVVHPDGAWVYRFLFLTNTYSGVLYNAEQIDLSSLHVDWFEKTKGDSLKFKYSLDKSIMIEGIGRVEKILDKKILKNGLMWIRYEDLATKSIKEIIRKIEMIETSQEKINFTITAKGSSEEKWMHISYKIPSLRAEVLYYYSFQKKSFAGYVKISNLQGFESEAENIFFDSMRLNQRPSYSEPVYGEKTARALSSPEKLENKLGIRGNSIKLGGGKIEADNEEYQFFETHDVIPKVCFSYELSLEEITYTQTQPILEFPNFAKKEKTTNFAEGEVIIYDSQGILLTKGQLKLGADKFICPVQELEMGLRLSNDPSYKELEDQRLEISNSLTFYYTGSDTTKVKLKFPWSLYWHNIRYSYTGRKNSKTMEITRFEQTEKLVLIYRRNEQKNY